jgi:hypothetical protein
VITRAGEPIRHRAPGGADRIDIRLLAFSLETAHRDD